ncbi:protein KOKOPELLI-like [Papaver somniferum]|uniref:protein KOKOPELLI-like n=1 Tax=Papaver somniferum TaxID=3469 RepID=UPI000E702026|nr:protein KOKOPELLI-like [Papaver somniferum]
MSSPKKKKVGPSRQRYSNSSYDVILAPTLMRFEPDIVESYSDSSSCSESRSRSRSISPARFATSSTGSNSPNRYQRTLSWESTYSIYSASSSGSVAPNTSYNEYSSGNRRESHPRGRTRDHRRRSPDYSCSSSRCTSRSRSPDEVYSHRRNRGSNVHPSNHSTDKVGWFRRIRNKLGFHHQDDHHHHPRRHNTGVKSSKEDETVHTHNRSVANPVSNGKLHRRSNDQMVRKNNRRTQVKNEPKQHGHVRKFFGGVVGHFLGSNKSKPSTAGKRRLERTVTGKGNVVRKKLHWWQKIHRRGSSNVGKSRAKLGMKTKYPKSKGYKHNTKMKKLLGVNLDPLSKWSMPQ